MFEGLRSEGIDLTIELRIETRLRPGRPEEKIIGEYNPIELLCCAIVEQKTRPFLILSFSPSLPSFFFSPTTLFQL